MKVQHNARETVAAAVVKNSHLYRSFEFRERRSIIYENISPWYSRPVIIKTIELSSQSNTFTDFIMHAPVNRAVLFFLFFFLAATSWRKPISYTIKDNPFRFVGVLIF